MTTKGEVRTSPVIGKIIDEPLIRREELHTMTKRIMIINTVMNMLIGITSNISMTMMKSNKP